MSDCMCLPFHHFLCCCYVGMWEYMFTRKCIINSICVTSYESRGNILIGCTLFFFKWKFKSGLWFYNFVFFFFLLLGGRIPSSAQAVWKSNWQFLANHPGSSMQGLRMLCFSPLNKVSWSTLPMLKYPQGVTHNAESKGNDKPYGVRNQTWVRSMSGIFPNAVLNFKFFIDLSLVCNITKKWAVQSHTSWCI